MHRLFEWRLFSNLFNLLGFVFDWIEVIPAFVGDAHGAPPSANNGSVNVSLVDRRGKDHGCHGAADDKGNADGDEPSIEELFHGALGVGSL